jgi:hypothetical protein
VQPCPKVQLDSELLPNENFFSIVRMGEGERRIGHEPRLPFMKFLTPDMIGRIASALGLNQTDTSSAIGTAVPALLAALTGVATQPDGPQKLADIASMGLNEAAPACSPAASVRFRW